MSGGELHPASTEKHGSPIVRVQRIRRAGRRRQAILALFVLLVIGGVMGGGYFLFMLGETELTVSGYSTAIVSVEVLRDTVEVSGSVAARTTATVTTPESGFVDALFVEEGDWVERGSLVARIDARSLVTQVESLERSLARSLREADRFLLEHEYALRRYERGRGSLEDALDDAEAELMILRELSDLGSVSRSEVENAEKAVLDAQEAIDEHVADVEEATALYEFSLVNYEDDIDSSRREIAELGERLAATTITAPISGRVLSIATSATVAGELLQQYATILQLADTRDPVIESEIEEQYVPSIGVGQSVTVEVAGVRYQGAVERIGQVASTSSDGGTPKVEIDITIDADAGEILPGTSALVEILIGQIDDALVLPRGQYLTSGNRRYLFRVDGETAERVDVTYGTMTDDRVRIISGVEAGDRIITSSYQSYVDRTTVRLGGEE